MNPHLKRETTGSVNLHHDSEAHGEPPGPVSLWHQVGAPKGWAKEEKKKADWLTAIRIQLHDPEHTPSPLGHKDSLNSSRQGQLYIHPLTHPNQEENRGRQE
jgi:hypothetical protein